MARRATQHDRPDSGTVARLLGELPVLVLRSGQHNDVEAHVQRVRADAHVDVVVVAGQGLAEGAPVEASFTRFDDATYRFRTVVLAAPDTITPLHRLAWPVELDREQHRAHVRAPIHAEVQLAPAGLRRVGAGRATGLDAGWCRADLVDLSGGGAGVVAPAGLDAGQTVLVHGCVQGREDPVLFELRARVVRAAGTVRRDGSPGDLAAYGLHFLDLGMAEQDRLVATVLWCKATALRP